MSAVLWQRLDKPGFESARIGRSDSLWLIEGNAVFDHEGAACALHYLVTCDGSWRTRSARVAGWVGAETIDVTVDADPWRLNAVPVADVDGCIDIDLNFSPSTNLLPIRRLNLAVGASVPVRAAWLRFPSFRLEPLEQTYTRTGERNFRYQSANGGFVADLELDATGMLVAYGDLWRAVTTTAGRNEPRR